MLRKTMIVLAKAAALTSGLPVEAFAHGDAEGMRGPRCGWLRVKSLHRHRKPPPRSMGGCSRWDKYEPASSIFG